jgi:hypothetical protein
MVNFSDINESSKMYLRQEGHEWMHKSQRLLESRVQCVHRGGSLVSRAVHDQSFAVLFNLSVFIEAYDLCHHVPCLNKDIAELIIEEIVDYT